MDKPIPDLSIEELRTICLQAPLAWVDKTEREKEALEELRQRG